jgi:superfamily II DNA/RNA helicase
MFVHNISGSGKTAAYLVPILSKLMGKAKKLAAPRPNPATYKPGVDAPVTAEPLVVIVAPTRELAVQIFNEARKFCYRTMLRPCVVYGGGTFRDQQEQLGRGCDVLIGTPGRLVDFLERPAVLTLRRMRYIVIDEADEMLAEDWKPQLDKIMAGGGESLLFDLEFREIEMLTRPNRSRGGHYQLHALLGHLSQGRTRLGEDSSRGHSRPSSCWPCWKHP